MDEHLSVGKTISHYRITGKLGSGGMGEVYLAEDVRLGRSVALKLLPSAFTRDPDRVLRFEQEARSASALNHPNIITIHEIGEFEGAHFIVTEFIDGETLRRRMGHTRMKLRDALEVAIQVAGALAAAHSAGIVHRDIKPENIMVRPDGYVKVLDFGLAKLTESPAAADTDAPTSTGAVTEAGTVMGTTRYMSPEQVRGLDLDARSDIFSLGVVLYEMIAGRRPFEGATAGEVMAAILDREPPPLAQYARETPEALEWTLTKALAKEREERYQTVKDLALDLKSLERRLEKPAGRAPKRHKLGTAAALAVVIAGAAALVYLGPWARRGSQVDQPPVQRALSRVTFDAGLQSEPTWSPDGRFVAYSSDRSGNIEIYVQPVGEGNPVQVTHSAAHDRQPDWSPDGNRIVFRSEREGGGLYVVPALGGSERRISSFGYYPHWSRDGTQILFIGSDVRLGSFPKVWVVGLDGNTPREVLADFFSGAGYDQFGFRHLAWHPDGRVSILAQHPKSGLGLWTVPLAGGAAVKSDLAPEVAQQINAAAVDFQRFSWGASGRALYFVGTSRGVTNLWKVTVDPKALSWIGGPERLTTGAGADTDVSLSADGKKLAFTTRLESTRVWALPFDAAAGRLAGEGQPVTPAGVNCSVLDLTRDGKRLAYLAERPGKQELWEKSLEDGSEKLLVADDTARRGYLVWSRDGTRLAYFRVTGPRQNAIVVLPAGGGDEQVIVPADWRQGPKSWSADGQWLLCVTTRPPSERWKIWLVPIAAAPHAETQARIVGADPDYNLYQAQFSPDERWIAFMAVKATDALASTICVMPATGGEWRRLTDGKYLDDKLRWSPDGRVIYFTSPRGGFTNVWGIRFDPVKGQSAGEPFRVTKFESPNKLVAPTTRTTEISLTADRLALPIMEISGSIWILENVDR